MTGLDLIETTLKDSKENIHANEIGKAIKVIKMLSALRKPCKIKDLTELTGWGTHSVKIALKNHSAIIAKKKTKPEVYQLAAYKGSSL